MPSHHQKNPHGGKNRSPSGNEKTYSTSEAIIALKDELIREAKVSREQQPLPDKTHKCIEIATLIFVILTTVGVFAQAIIMHSSDVTFKDTLELQRTSNERQLRAYVGMSPGDIEDFGNPGKQRIRFVRKNYGLTPAYDVGFSSVGMAIIKPGEPINTGPYICGKPNISGLITMFPSTELPLIINEIDAASSDGAKKVAGAFSAEDIRLVKSGERLFVYFGTICYNDTFKRPHHTNYCWMYKGNSMTARDAEGCLTHNDSN